MAGFCYPFKEALVYFMNHVYFDIEKDMREENIANLWQTIELITDDLNDFIKLKKILRDREAHPRLNIIKSATNTSLFDGAKSPNGSMDMPSKTNRTCPFSHGVDISINFKLMTCFGSNSILKHFEDYIFGTVIPSLEHFFELRLNYNSA